MFLLITWFSFVMLADIESRFMLLPSMFCEYIQNQTLPEHLRENKQERIDA